MPAQNNAADLERLLPGAMKTNEKVLLQYRLDLIQYHETVITSSQTSGLPIATENEGGFGEEPSAYLIKTGITIKDGVAVFCGQLALRPTPDEVFNSRPQ